MFYCNCFNLNRICLSLINLKFEIQNETLVPKFYIFSVNEFIKFKVTN